MSNVIQIGSIVRLKSGGPAMTVGRIYTGGNDHVQYATCNWFESGKPMRENYPLTSLEPEEQ